MSAYTLSTPPARVRAALEYHLVQGHTRTATCRDLGLSDRSLRRWIALREEHGPAWPGLELDLQWDEIAAARAHQSARLRRYRTARYLNGGQPLMVNPLGTRRRVQALLALGWTAEHIAAETPWTTYNAVLELLDRPRHKPNTARIIAVAYERLSMTRGPSDLTRRRAARNGWAPPLAWDNIDDPRELPATYIVEDLRTTADVDVHDVDEAVVLRVLAGDLVPATPAERAEVRRRWVAAGRPVNELARWTGWNVQRYASAVAS